MPAGGAGGAGGGGGDMGLGGFADLFGVAMERMQKARDAELTSLQETREKIAESIQQRKDELANLKLTPAQYAHISAELDKQQKLYTANTASIKKITDARKAENKALDEGIGQYAKYSAALAKAGKTIRDNLNEYHQYNLVVQHAIDRTGRAGEAARRSSDEFEHLRKTLNLTRAAATEFAGAWSDAMGQGTTNAQLERMVANLQKIHGMAEGMKMAKEVIATPMARSTREGVMGGDVKSVAEAIRTANADQSQAILGTMRQGQGRTQGSQEAARFQVAEAKLAKVGDDIKLFLQSGVAAGLGPETAALLSPLLDINAKMAELVKNTMPMGKWAAQQAKSFLSSGAKVAGAVAMAAPALSVGAGMLGGKYFDTLADAQAKGSRKHQLATGAGVGARIAGWTGAGALVGGGIPGAIAGAITGAAVELREPIVDGGKTLANEFLRQYITGTDYFHTQAMDALTPKQQKANEMQGALNEWKVSNDKSLAAMQALNATLEEMPEALHAQLAKRAMDVEKASVDPKRFDAAAKISQAGGQAQSGRLIAEANKEIWRKQQERDTRINNMRATTPGFTEKDANVIREEYSTTISKLQQGLQAGLQKENLGGEARETMAGMDTRRGQIGTEREAAETRFKRLGETTGSQEEAIKYQETLKSKFAEEVQLLKDRNAKADELVALDIEVLKKRQSAKGITAEVASSIQNEINNLKNETEQRHRVRDAQTETVKLTAQTADLAAEQARITQYEKTGAFKRAGQQKALATAEESYYRERGARPEEIGGAARTRAAAATTQRQEFQKTSATDIERLTGKMHAARAAGGTANEALAIGYQNQILELQKKGVELVHEEFKAKKEAVTTEERFRQETLGAQRTGLEIQAASAAKMGASWRVQMGYQSQIIKNSQEDLMSSRRELAAMADTIIKEGGSLNSKEYIDAQNKVLQKQAAVQEQILGRQRGFLDQAIGAGFGMGGGTKFQPNVNAARIFGEQVQGPGGMKQAGRPMTMGEQRQLLMQSAGTPITGAIGGGGIPAVPVLPGAAGPAGAIPGGAGGAGAAPGGASAGGGEGVDISGKIQLAVHFDTNMLKTEIRKEIIAAAKPGPRLA